MAMLTDEEIGALKTLVDMGFDKTGIENLYKNTTELKVGSPIGNPGYSFAAPTYSTQHYNAGTGEVTGRERLTPGGVTYVGQGEDTQANRDLFEDWLRNFSIVNPSRLNYLDPISAPNAQPMLTGGLEPESPNLALNPQQANRFEGMTGDDWASLERLKALSGLSESDQGALRFMSDLGLNETDVGLLSQFQSEPVDGPTSNERKDWLANEFRRVVQNTPGLYEELNPTEQMQYQWLLYENGQISGNQKDDRIKKIRQENDLPKELFEGEQRFIWRNKPTQDNRRDGITSGDVFGIGTPTQPDTGKDDGFLTGAISNVVNPFLPGFSVADVANTLAPITEPITNALDSDLGRIALTAANLYGGLGSLTEGAASALAAVNNANFASGMLQDAQDPVGNAEDGPMIGNTPVLSRPGWHWERNTDPDAVGKWKAVRDEPQEGELGGGQTSGGTTGGGGPTDGSSGGNTGGGVNPEDIWIWGNGVLKNTTTGETKDIPNPGRMEEGGLYNGDGDPIGDQDQTDPGQKEESDDYGWLPGLVLGGIGAGGLGSWGSGGSGGSGTDGSTGGSTGGSGGGGSGGSGGGSGGGTGGGEGDGEGDGDGSGDATTPSGAFAQAVESPEWKDFMSGINVNFELLQKLGVSPRDYLRLLFEGMNK